MRYIALAAKYLKKQVGPLILGLLLGATLFSAMVADSTEGGFEDLRFIPVIAVFLVIFDVIGILFSGMGHSGSNPSTEDAEDGTMVFNLGAAVGSGVVLGAVVNPLFGFLYAIGVFFCTAAILGVLIGLLLVSEFCSKDCFTGKRWNWPLRRQ